MERIGQVNDGTERINWKQMKNKRFDFIGPKENQIENERREFIEKSNLRQGSSSTPSTP